MGLLDDVQDMGDVNPFLKIALYGDPGVGKTSLAASGPSPLLLDVEEGKTALVGRPGFSKVRYKHITTFKDFDAIFWELYDGGAPDRELIIVDTFTELVKRNLDNVVKNEVKTNAQRKGNPFNPQLQDYGQNNYMMRRLLVQFCELPRHVVFTFHAEETKDDNVLTWRPSVPPKVWDSIEGLMDVIGFISVETGKDGTVRRTLQIQPSRRVKAKCRLYLPEYPSGIIELPEMVDGALPAPNMMMFVNALERMNQHAA